LLYKLLRDLGRSELAALCVPLQSLLCIFRILTSLPSFVDTSESVSNILSWFSSCGDLCELWSLILLAFAWLRIIRVFYAKKKLGNSYRPDRGKVVDLIRNIFLGVTMFVWALYSVFYWLYYARGERISTYGTGYILYDFLALIICGTLMAVFGGILSRTLRKEIGATSTHYSAKINKVVHIIGCVIAPIIIVSFVIVIKRTETTPYVIAQLITVSVCEIIVACCFISFFGAKYTNGLIRLSFEGDETSTTDVASVTSATPRQDSTGSS